MNRIVNVNKPKGLTSFGVVKELKKFCNIKKVGHLGTLDPLATGVLPVFIGKATKLIPLFDKLDKEYRATFKLGEQTDTFDTEGKITKTAHIGHLTCEQIERCVSKYQGVQKQLTPVFSAVKYNGVPGYRLARAGKAIERKSRVIHIESICIESIKLPFVAVRVKCSKGTYIRSLVDDIGQELGIGAHLVELERVAVGSCFSLSNACQLEELKQFGEHDNFPFYINPVDVLNDLKTITVTDKEQNQLIHGQPIAIDADLFSFPCHDEGTNNLVKAINSQNLLIAIGRVVVQNKSCQFNPSKIFV
ncbi:MAG: tRNA pseudouridine(55) synthase TruB [SAR324 cluster bacterium]|nr:tRNA pseudouridine(55) synthase TruB [SAR324 cluster bacterium]